MKKQFKEYKEYKDLPGNHLWDISHSMNFAICTNCRFKCIKYFTNSYYWQSGIKNYAYIPSCEEYIMNTSLE